MQPLGVGRDAGPCLNVYVADGHCTEACLKIHMTLNLRLYKIRYNMGIRISVRGCDLKELMPCFCGLAVCTIGSKCIFRDICVCLCI